MSRIIATQEANVALTAIVPVYNAREHIEPLVHAFLGIEGVRCQVILVDDHSDDGSSEEIARMAANFSQVMALYHPANMGAGCARNLAFSHAQGRYTIFFDVDDRLHGEAIAPAIAILDNEPELDTAMFAYRYERDETASFTAMSMADQESFYGALKGADITTAVLQDVALLLCFTNYPWNKIIRTAHFQEAGLRFGKTKVNNDILGHWYSLLFARRILIVDKVICTHIVHPKGQNLTNRFGAERLQMFEALIETNDMLEAHPSLQRHFAHHFWDLVNTLVLWARPRIDADVRLEFESCYRDLISRINLEVFSKMRVEQSPRVASRFVRDLIGSV